MSVHLIQEVWPVSLSVSVVEMAPKGGVAYSPVSLTEGGVASHSVSPRKLKLVHNTDSYYITSCCFRCFINFIRLLKRKAKSIPLVSGFLKLHFLQELVKVSSSDKSTYHFPSPAAPPFHQIVPELRRNFSHEKHHLKLGCFYCIH